VFLAGLEDGLLPHSRSFSDPEGMAEERRLLYVGITRAKDRLYLSYAFRRMVFGESSLNEPSRFLNDIPAELTEGLSVKMTAMQDRAGYQRLTSWDADDSWGRGNRGASQPSGKIVPFPGSRAFQKPARLPPAAPASPYKIGQRVRHAKFGEGIVQEVERVGQDVEVIVRFEDAGTKRLSTAFAKLQIL
jgi:DNA helicase-2/ATP-dependent DNA helicase PcrA